jgi:hypothetical protein
MEFALLSPWIFTLFIGTLNLGLIYHSITAVQNAARAAVMYAASNPWVASDAQGACAAALRELSTLPNARSLSTCDAAPLELSLTAPAGLAGEQVARVSIAYTSVRLITLPPVPDHLTITRTAEMRVRAE